MNFHTSLYCRGKIAEIFEEAEKKGTIASLHEMFTKKFAVERFRDFDDKKSLALRAPTNVDSHRPN